MPDLTLPQQPQSDELSLLYRFLEERQDVYRQYNSHDTLELVNNMKSVNPETFQGGWHLYF